MKEWEEYAELDEYNTFTILQERLENEVKENSIRELLDIIDDDLQEQEMEELLDEAYEEHWYWNDSLYEDM